MRWLALAATLAACECAEVRPSPAARNDQCTRCHGSDASPAPPRDLLGRDDPSLRGVGAHAAHLRAGRLGDPVACDTCHVVPRRVDEPGHMDHPWPALVRFSGPAVAGGATPRTEAPPGSGHPREDSALPLACASTYCHGATLAGGRRTAPVWNAATPEDTACDACHGSPPPAPHPQSERCAACHDTAGDGPAIALRSQHVDGRLQVRPMECDGCHGSATSSAPPKDAAGQRDPWLVTVGAHTSHLGATLGRPVACAECHEVPATVEQPGHVDAAPAEVRFGALSAHAGAAPAWDRASARCASTYCHGATLGGGANTTPRWTSTNGSQVTCGACHGLPPPPPHPASTRCEACHPGTAGPRVRLARTQDHVDGQVQSVEPACDACHGAQGDPAPPSDTTGGTATTLVGVGAHRAHLDATLSAPVACGECHAVPATAGEAGHILGEPARLRFGPLAAAEDAAPAWDRASATCAATYCHGATLAGGTTPAPRWTRVDGSQAACGACHGLPPPAPHPQARRCSACHPQTAGDDGSVAHPDQHVDGRLQLRVPACNACHGSAANAAPPADLQGGDSTASLSVGAHQQHLNATRGRPVACAECHPVPAAVFSDGHLDGASADVAFSGVAAAGGLAPVWDRSGATCSATWCHGAQLAGGTRTTPRWNVVDGSQAACGSCHGAPPPAPHPQAGRCSACHPETMSDDGTLANAAAHVDGVVQAVAPACNACHGSDANAAPPLGVDGATDPALAGVGAHQAHLRPVLGRAVACDECHVVPAAADAPGHLDGGPAGVRFGTLARTGDLSPRWSRSETTCASTWCHGARLAGGAATAPRWTTVDGSQKTCTSCHGDPPPPPHPQRRACAACHPDTVAPDGTIADADRHVDGVVQTALLACSSCHGGPANAAPPADVEGRESTALVGVGAHQSHVAARTGRVVACAECHPVPTAVAAPGHRDGLAQVRFGPLSGADGAAPAWTRATATCAGSYCHGATLGGGTGKAPVWTQVDGSQAACGSCHGHPPPAPHPQAGRCSACHPQTAAPDGTIAAADFHVDGVVQAAAPACNACHGGPTGDAPPADLAGGSATSSVGVGAHRKHLAATLGRPVACAECHVVPATTLAAGHLDGALPAEVVFGALSRTGGAAPAWNRATATCSASWCHGAKLAGGAATAPRWTKVDGTQSTCGSCHGNPPPAPHPAAGRCSACHPETMAADGTIAHPARHVDGLVQVAAPACNACHGGPTSDAPPADLAGGSATTALGVGAHRAHLGATLGRDVACAECHVVPSTTLAAGHVDTAAPAEIAFGSLARTGGAAPAWDRATATCSASWCHGAKLAGGAATAPRWTRVDGTQKRCTSCHGNPPPAPHPAGGRCSACHPTAAPDGSIADRSRHVDGVVQTAAPTCTACHGGPSNAAPPLDTAGASATTRVGVGAHQRHLAATLGRPVACAECHLVPATEAASGHLDSALPAEVVFGALAKTGGLSPGWAGSSATCAATWCHGAALGGGTNTRPVWTVVDGTQDACGTCHGRPPPAPHPSGTQCSACHGETMAADGTIANPLKHIDGVVQASGACNSCHGSAAGNAPPRDTAGGTSTALVTVGAHQAHLAATGGKVVACAECHAVPATTDAAGHLDAAPAEVVFGALSRTGGAAPAWDRPGATCNATYCHGATLGGGSNKRPLWTRVDGSQDACGTCHGNPPPAPHPAGAQCSVCHTETVRPDGTFLDAQKHVDGTVQVVAACNSCHGGATNAAPPVDTAGAGSTALVTVGAHQAHLGATTGKVVACAECHTVPAATDAPGHRDAAPAEVLFGALARADGAAPVWTRTTATCAGSYCHGATLGGGTNKTPLWNRVDGTQDACGTCHGRPPPAPHPQDARCSVCHPQTAAADGTIADPTRHVDGTVQSTVACDSCHGSAANSAPPRDTTGGTATALVTVGAHQAHLGATTGRVVACAECHLVPASLGSAGHRDTAEPAEVSFGTLSRADGAAPTWARATATCAGNYCHGATLGGGTNRTPLWNRVDGSQDACGTCHGRPPPAPHPPYAGCVACHPATIAADGSIGTPANHVDGTVQYQVACNSCHGDAASSAPPRDTTGGTATSLVTVGTHRSHLSATLGASVACGECHAVPATLGAAGHRDSAAPAELTWGTLARTGGAAPAWNRTAATCATTYCHGATLVGGTLRTPIWTRADRSQIACGACHGRSPRTGRHPSNFGDHSFMGTNCTYCHEGMTNTTGTQVLTPATHIDGTKNVDIRGTGTWSAATRSCRPGSGCHGSETW